MYHTALAIKELKYVVLIRKTVFMVLALGGLVLSANAAELSEISNYREYSANFSSSGQPTKTQMEQLKSEGFERIIYIAFTNGSTALANEDVITRELGMEYFHIPVVWDKPTASDFYAFADIMKRYPDKKSLLHCKVNYRATAFSFLYRVIYLDVPVAEAKEDLNSVWAPDKTWRKLIFSILEENGKSAQCEGCNWDQ